MTVDPQKSGQSASVSPAGEAPPPPPPAPPSPPSGKKIWRAGTLTYTGGGLVILFLWLLWGDFAWALRDRTIGPSAQWYLNQLGTSDMLFGLLFSSLPSLVGLVIVPIISVKSDRHRGRFGRRIPFLLVTTPLTTLGMAGLAVTPLLALKIHAHFPAQNPQLVALTSFGLFWGVFEIASIAGSAILNGLVNDVVPAPLLGRFYGLFRAVSLIDGILFNYWVLGLVPSHYTLILLVVSVFYALAFFQVCLRVKEGGYPPPPPPSRLSRPSRGCGKTFATGAGTYFHDCYSNGYYVTGFLALMAAGVCFLPLNVFSLPYAESLGVSMDTYGKGQALTYFCSLLLAWPIGWLADKVHPLRVAIAALGCYALVMAAGLFWATTQRSFLAPWILHGVVCGSYYTGAASLGLRLYPRARFAQFASAAGILGSLAHMLAGPLVGALIDINGKSYRCTFGAGLVLALTALFAMGVVHKKFMRLGGPVNYKAPDVEIP
ncbi:MAG: MFS transporter [Opitutaceae bacterium]|nr:MFS transporter [Opitutaceae bacterium]